MKFSGFEEFAKECEEEAEKWSDAADEVDDFVEEGLETTGRFMKRRVENKAPRSTPSDPQAKRDGEPHLEDTIELRQNGRWEFEVRVNAEHGVYVEYGRQQSYTITPKDPHGVLVFFSDGEKVVTQRVRHPGYDAQPFFRPAYELTRKEFGHNLNREFKKFMKRHFR